ncbi:MAG: hypothetical protein H6841_07630 [Planctomycetes bacterium]|nr:hypothetical protein [Planctomycetota bacterium]MCB9935228.1 hypothetical protein [Planctomycetota bacterium]
MKRAHLPALLMALVLGWLFIDAVHAQRVRIVRGGPRPASPEPGAARKPDPANDPNALQPVPPTPEEAERISELIEQLGSERLVQRDRAMSELAGFEARALTQVREAKGHDDDEIATRCALLEEVIMSREGEFFLAARRLNLTIDELKQQLRNDDVSPLLSILRARAQPGLVALWARVFAQLAGRTQLFPAAELCLEVEGSTGYGQALAKAARAPEAAAGARNLLLLMALQPPGEPADTVEAMTQLRFSIGAGRGIEEVLSASVDFRKVYAAPALLSARGGRPEPNAGDPEGAAEVRTALALNMIESCTEAELDAAGLPAIEAMSPMLLSTWLGLLRRSGLKARIEGAVLAVLADGGDARRLGITAAAWANVAEPKDLIEVFDELPLEAQLSVLDAWWLNPREPRVLQPFLVRLLDHERAGVRAAAALSLGQYRAPGTARALLRTSLGDEATAPAALESLLPMTELLSDSELDSLAEALPAAGLMTRPLLAEALLRSGRDRGLTPLIDGWRELLPRNELPLAIKVLASRTESPAGAFAATHVANALASGIELDDYLLRYPDNADLEMLRALLALDDAAGFKLLHAMAADLNDASRLHAMQALALAGRDAELVTDWLKRFAGEIWDPLGQQIGSAIALSTSDAAEEFRRNTLLQGAGASNLALVLQSVLAGRSRTVSREQLLEVLFDTPENAQRWSGNWELIRRPLPRKAARNLATALAFTEGSNLLSSPGVALLLADSGVDMLEVLYGNAANPAPRDTLQLYATALLCDPDPAGVIVKRAERQEDGSNYVGLQIARAWLGLLPPEESRRLRQAVSADPTSVFGALAHLRRAREGQASALRGLLDAFGPDAVRFQRGATAEARIVDQRWGRPYMDVQGVGAAAYSPQSSPLPLAAAQLAALFEEAPADGWRGWWACRRALMEFVPETGKYRFVELP